MTFAARLAHQRRVFVDSSAYLALLDRDDEHHSEASSVLTWLAQARYRQYTTNILIIECHALVLSSLGIRSATEFLKGMSQSHTVIVRVRANDEIRAKELVFKFTDKDFSFADAISFVVMERLNIKQAFTFDRHFERYGFHPLRADRL